MLDSNPNWVVHCTEIKDLAKALFEHSRLQLDNATLLLVTDGVAALTINGHEEHVSFGHLMVVDKDSVIQLSPPNRPDFSAYIICFNVYDTVMSSLCQWSVNTTTGYYMQKVSEMAVTETALALAGRTEEWKPTIKQFMLYSLLKELKQEQQREEYTLEQRIEKTVIYMGQKYNQMITREDLAAIAGYSPSYYSRTFARLHHKTPIEYLISYRIFRAQEMLLTTEDLSRNIAKKTGFDDPHYFNRQFRIIVGSPPKQYKKNIANYRICFLSSAHAEIAVSLGVRPDCVIVNKSLTPDYQKDMFFENGAALLEMPQYVIHQDTIVQRQPDLIIGAGITEEAKQYFRSFAPIITRLPDDLNMLILYFGRLFNKENKAAQLIQELTQQAEAVKSSLQYNVPPDATALYLRVEESGYRYIGESSSSAALLLYKEFGFQMPDIFQKNEFFFNPCTLQQLEEANPTYLFVEKRIMDYYNADRSLFTLQTSRQWANLDAVKNKRVLYVDTGLWINNCSVIGKRKMMEQIEQLIKGNECLRIQ